MSLYDIQDNVYIRQSVRVVGGTFCSIRPWADGYYRPFRKGQVLEDIRLSDNDILCVRVSTPKNANRSPVLDGEAFYIQGDRVSVVDQSTATSLFGGFITDYMRFYGKSGVVLFVDKKGRQYVIKCNGVNLLIHGDLLNKASKRGG